MLNISITEGGCSKPGHTAYTSDDGTCYCLTCELEQENSALKAQVEQYSAKNATAEQVVDHKTPPSRAENQDAEPEPRAHDTEVEEYAKAHPPQDTKKPDLHQPRIIRLIGSD
jgi:uncharacterized Zn finger protein (UPF0148 family)